MASSPDVKSIRSADKATANKINTSEGDITHQADLARTSFSVDGSGITVGIISDSVDSLTTLQGSGDLPPACPATPCSKFLTGQSGNPGTSEGTAMMEIVDDLAPGANVFFATGFAGQASFASNITALANAGAQVIADDVTYFAEPVFQDGIIAQAINSFVAAGGVYLTASANNGNLTNPSTAGTYEGDFAGVTTTVPGQGSVVAHDFGGGQSYDPITVSPTAGRILFQWSDKFGASSNDYDLYLLDSTGTNVIASSTGSQSGTQDPRESLLVAGNLVGDRIVIVLFSGSNRFLHLDLPGDGVQGLGVATSGATFGHNSAAQAVSVAAVDVHSTGCPPPGGGPCTPFVGGSTNPVEPFSSDGPRRIFYDPSGNAITPGNFSSTGGQLLQKPDLAAADGVKTATPGFNPFFGTSGAAPHAAAIAALVLSKNPALSVAHVKSILKASTLDVDPAGVDRDTGYGILSAQKALDLIFKDGFESNDLTAWDANTGVTVGAPALIGNFGLQVPVSGTSGRYVEDDSPNAENEYRARFYFDPNGFDPGQGSNHFRVRLLLASDTLDQRIITLVLRRIGTAYTIKGRVRLDDGTRADTAFFPITDAPHVIELQWIRATTPTSQDGLFQITIDQTPQTGITGLDNNASTIDHVRLGALSVKTGAAGTLLFDEFESRRLSFIGP